ncbi:LacI family DNA-binding transcriptional regulator [Neobacillus sp. SuZ13]|uniref:LacI family DNA-binding transcriptional regulator n=1 Tax=Neobacillus sp. SuZ13 TaxID=3047875 RepID=UPI0024C0BAE6|nr:LacI family DNA-binding transcriptional regulator [Neobacillus sp. SuZ13]WHY67401.1 LacI family DNA-binding transcriptional regulator [Neobacillus sp. SuZ13]
MKLTIKKIAELTGVSTATVSKVLNNTGRYSEETKKRILDLVEKYDYKPNAVAKSLRTSRSKTIGVIVPDITNEFFAQIVLAIDNYCSPNGYSVFICNSGENEEKDIQFFKELELKGVDGLIYLSASEELFAMKTKLPIVCIDRTPHLHNFAAITSDNFKGGQIAAEELVKKNCKNILVITDYRDVPATTERVRGFQSVLEKIGMPYGEDNLLTAVVGIEPSKEAVNSLIQSGKFNYDGIFAINDSMAFGAMIALKENGFKVPEDVKIIGCDNISLSKYNSITSIHQDKDQLGQRAAELLINRIERGIYTKEIIKLPVKLIERDSTRNCE